MPDTMIKKTDVQHASTEFVSRVILSHLRNRGNEPFGDFMRTNLKIGHTSEQGLLLTDSYIANRAYIRQSCLRGDEVRRENGHEHARCAKTRRAIRRRDRSTVSCPDDLFLHDAILDERTDDFMSILSISSMSKATHFRIVTQENIKITCTGIAVDLR